MKTVNIVIPLIGLILLVILTIITINKPIQPPFNQSDYRQHIIDSVRISDNKQKVAEIEAMQAIENEKVLSAKKKVSFYRNEAERLKHISDSLISAHEAELDTICREIITSKQNEIDTLNRVVNELDIEAESYSRNLYLCETKYDLKVTDFDLVNTENGRLKVIISEKDKTINCLRNRNFWTWLFNRKCK